MAHESRWTLADAAAIAAENPYTFWKPSEMLAAALRPGDFVQLIFELNSVKSDDPNAERMWVQVAALEPGMLRGYLDIVPQQIAGLAKGAEIQFEARHIVDASIEDPVPSPTVKWLQRCFVTRKILYEGASVGFLYREAPDSDRDSGWRFLCGDETEDYISSNTSCVSLGAILSRDDRFLHLLEKPAPIAFEWDAKSKQFIEALFPVPD